MPKKLAGLAPRRRAMGLTQKQLAEQAGVTREAVAYWEAGKFWPSAAMLPKLADLLLCSIDELYRTPEDGDAERRSDQGIAPCTENGASA